MGVQDSSVADPEARERAVSLLFRQHNQMLVRFLEARLQNRQEARDVAQEAYVRLLELERTGAVGFLRAYLFKVASNLAIDRLRGRHVRARVIETDLFEDLGDDIDQTQDTVAAQQEVRLFWSSLLELPPHIRQAVVLNRLHDMPCEVIGLRLGRTARMVRRYIVYALVYCRRRIDGMSAEQTRASLRSHDD